MEERFYDFKVGAKWIFDAVFDGNKRQVNFTVARREPGRTIVEYDIYNPPDPGATASMDQAWYLEDGHVLWGDAEPTKPWWRVYKVGSRRGDTWQGPNGKGKAEHLGVDEVVVPAGSFPDAVHIRLEDEDAKIHDFYYAPLVGLVKWRTSGLKGAMLLQLKFFSSGS